METMETINLFVANPITPMEGKKLLWEAERSGCKFRCISGWVKNGWEADESLRNAGLADATPEERYAYLVAAFQQCWPNIPVLTSEEARSKYGRYGALLSRMGVAGFDYLVTTVTELQRDPKRRDLCQRYLREEQDHLSEIFLGLMGHPEILKEFRLDLLALLEDPALDYQVTPQRLAGMAPLALTALRGRICANAYLVCAYLNGTDPNAELALNRVFSGFDREYIDQHKHEILAMLGEW